MLRTLKFFSAVLVLSSWVIYPQKSLAWGNLGHQIIGLIAEDHLSTNTKKRLQLMLSGESIEKASNWPDAIRNKEEWKHAKYYHYKSIPRDEDYFSDLKKISESQRIRGDILRALLRAEDILAKPGFSELDKKNAVRFFIHFLGDLHQPLHVGFPNDSGGNSISINWNGANTNLHSVWDKHMLYTYGEMQLPQITRPTAREIINSFKTIESSLLIKWKKGSYMDWLNESIRLRNAAYINIQTSNDNYYREHTATIQEQLQKAGYRLAQTLEILLGSTPQITTANKNVRESILNIIGTKYTDFQIDLQLGPSPSFRMYSSPYEDIDEAHHCNH